MFTGIMLGLILVGIAVIIYSKRKWESQMEDIDAMGRDRIASYEGNHRNHVHIALDAVGDDFDNIYRGEN